MRKCSKFLTVLMILLLCLSSTAMADNLFEPTDASSKEFAAANLFLSNFTEVGVESIQSWDYDYVFVDFAHDHIWFNDQSAYEYGEYFNDNNCRVSDDSIQRIINNYFYNAPQVDLSQTRFDYRGGYYYHCETGGSVNCGFAHTLDIVPCGDNFYYVSFLIFGGGNYWENSVMSAPLKDIIDEFGEYAGFGCAQIYAENLSDRSTYKMVSYSSLR